MQKQVLFAHSAGAQDAPGEGSYDLVTYLKEGLGEQYNILNPQIEDPEAPTYEMWKVMFKGQFAALTHPLILIGHSLGGSMLLKYLSEEQPEITIAGMFLVAIPQWGKDGWDVDTFVLSDNFSSALPAVDPVFFYHATHDQIVPFQHLSYYKKHFKNAVFREPDVSDHAFAKGLPQLVNDIKSLNS